MRKNSIFTPTLALPPQGGGNFSCISISLPSPLGCINWGGLRWGRTDVETADDSKKGEGGPEDSFGVDAISVPQNILGAMLDKDIGDAQTFAGDVRKVFFFE